MGGNFRIAVVARKRGCPQVVSLDKFIENFRAQYHCRRHLDDEVFIFVIQPEPVDQQIHKAEPACFSAQRSAADSRKTILNIKGFFFEIGDGATAAAFAVFSQIFDNRRAKFFNRFVFGNFAGTQLVRQPKLCSCFQPFRKMIAFGMIVQAFLRHPVQLALQRYEIAGAPDFLIVWHAENKIAKTELIAHKFPQIIQQRRRIFQQKGCADIVRLALKFLRCRLKHNWDVILLLFGILGKFNSRAGILLAIAIKINVRNDTQNRILIFFEIIPGVLIIGAKQDFRARAHPQITVGKVDAFGDQPLRLFEQFHVNDRQKRRIITNAIFN